MMQTQPRLTARDSYVFLMKELEHHHNHIISFPFKLLIIFY